MSTYVSVVISPETTTNPVLTRHSQATLPVGSSAMTASSTPSEIWSQTLSGWPSVTDSEVNRYSFSESCCIAPISVVDGQEESRAKLAVAARHGEAERADSRDVFAERRIQR